MRQIKRIFVHCTAGPQNQSIQEIQNYWKKTKKWVNPGYHYIIKKDGEIVQLLDESKPSNGVAGYNSTSIHVCYIGGVDKQGRAIDNRTDDQKASLITILTQLKSRYPDAEILGHRDIWGTDSKKWKKLCPCFNAKEEYKDITGELPEIVQPEVELTPKEEEEEEPEHVPIPPLATPPYFNWPDEEKKKSSIWSTIVEIIKLVPWKTIFKR